MATRIPSQSSSSSRSYSSDDKNPSRSPQNSRRRRGNRFIAPDESFLRKWRRRVFRFLTHPAFYLPLLLLIVSAVVTVGYFWSEYSHRIDLLLNGEIFTRSAGIYAAPKSIKNGDGLSNDEVISYLKAANYVDKNANADATRGRYRVDGNALEITPGDDAKIDSKQNYSALRVKFAKDGKSIAAIENLTTNENLKTVVLEPRLLSSANGEDRERRKTVAYQDIPPHLVKAITSTEDRAFFEHYGVNFRGIARALWRRYDTEDNSPIARQGGSSITQQLVKNLLLSPEKSLERKVQEAFMSIILETRLTKAEIFTLYANQIYLGQQASFSVNGVGEAANAYFGKDVSALSLSESAFIAGIIRSPNRYNPYKDLQKATERRNQVLDSMVDAKAISQAEAEAAKTVQLTIMPPAKRRELVDTPYFTEYAQQQLAGIVNDADALQHLRVYTSIDLDLQKAASDTLKNRLAKLDRYFPRKTGELNAALVAIRPKTGEIVAMVGGRDYLQSQFNRATDAQRQPGSVFKPFVYAAAINTAYDPTPRVITAATVFKDEAKTFTFNSDSYKPNNYGDFFSNKEVTLRDALVKSKNVITVDLAMELNVGKVMNLAAKAGLPKVPRAYPSMALGTAETTPLMMASAYTTFANNGVRTAPTIIDLVTTGDGRTVAAPLPQKTEVLRPDVNYVMVDMMKDVINRGTAADLRAWGFKNVAN
ncbi:MAG: transglycosylase domain-containing protein, partial [Pyrinomonadaceae bacterium]|nr:transglycosylase domain-containing protein [Pyrinomonadaceae bacterium]